MYAGKRRQRHAKSGKSAKSSNTPATAVAAKYQPGILHNPATTPPQQHHHPYQSGPHPPGSNPSKRHRERLNSELDNVAALLPLESSVISKLDKLSVLRLAAAFLQNKIHFQCTWQRLSASLPPFISGAPPPPPSACLPLAPKCGLRSPPHLAEDDILKTLQGFLLVISERGDIFYVSSNVEKYLGFHQSDILHQPIYDIIHSEDREDLRRQLLWNYGCCGPAISNGCPEWQAMFLPENQYLLKRNFSVRFRCLLDNTCGFIRLDLKARMEILGELPSEYYFMNRAELSAMLPSMALFAVASTFVPLLLDEVLSDADYMIKTKHSLDLSIVALPDNRGKLLFDHQPNDPFPISFYKRVFDGDLCCIAEAHKEVMKTGQSGILAFRLLMANQRRQKWLWLQSSLRLCYKNGKPDYISINSRILTEFEGLHLCEKRATFAAKLVCLDEALIMHQPTAPKPNSGDVPMATVLSKPPESLPVILTVPPDLSEELKPKRACAAATKAKDTVKAKIEAKAKTKKKGPASGEGVATLEPMVVPLPASAIQGTTMFMPRLPTQRAETPRTNPYWTENADVYTSELSSLDAHRSAKYHLATCSDASGTYFNVKTGSPLFPSSPGQASFSFMPSAPADSLTKPYGLNQAYGSIITKSYPKSMTSHSTNYWRNNYNGSSSLQTYLNDHIYNHDAGYHGNDANASCLYAYAVGVASNEIDEDEIEEEYQQYSIGSQTYQPMALPTYSNKPLMRPAYNELISTFGDRNPFLADHIPVYVNKQPEYKSTSMFSIAEATNTLLGTQ